MSPLDLAIPLGGVALIIFVVWALGGLRTASLGEDVVRQLLARDQPDFALGEVIVGRDGRSALGFDAQGKRLALLHSVGDNVAARLLWPDDLRSSRARGGDLVLALADFGARPIRLRLGDAGKAEQQRRRIEAWRAHGYGAAA
jgi:hypothetical protein